MDLLHQAQQAAVVRLHLWLLAKVHEALAKVGDAAHGVLRPLPGNEPPSPAAIAQLHTAVAVAWAEFIQHYTNMLGFALGQAASLPFGVLAIMHDAWIRPVVNGGVQESRLREQLNPDVLVQPQLQAIVTAAAAAPGRMG